MSDPTDQARQPASQPVPGATVLPPPSPGWTPAPAPASGPSPAPYPPAAYAPSWTPPQRNFRRGFGLGAGAGLGVGLTLLVLGLVGSLLSMLTFVGMAGALAGAGQTKVEPLKTIWGPETASKKLRAISVSGPIMADSGDGLTLGSGAYGYEIAQVIDGLSKSDADGLVLLLNTPGGSINGSKAIADAMARYKTRTGHPAFAYVQGMSASGGMYAMAGADKVLADHGSLVGSIGVIAGPFERYKDVTAITGTMLTAGVVTSGGITAQYITQGTGKDFGSPWRDMTDAERTNFANGMANEYEAFVAWVSAGRKIPAETIKGTLGAYIFDGKTATANKLIDGVQGRDEAFRDFATTAGLDPAQTRVVTATPPGMFAQLFGAQARVYGTSLPAPAIGGQAPRATASLCSGTPVILAYQGSLTGVCR